MLILRWFFLLSIILVFLPSISLASPYSLNWKNERWYLAAGGTMSLIGKYNDSKRGKLDTADVANLDRSDIPAFERSYAGRWNTTAQDISDGFLLLGFVSPLSMLLTEKHQWQSIGMLYLETFAISFGGMALVKGSVTRYRPYAYGSDAPESALNDKKTARSFFSGHASTITTGFIFSAKVFSDYYPNSKFKTHVWTAAIAGSIMGSWMRVEGGMHFPSDVVIGMMWGALVGYSVPEFHLKKRTFTYLPFADERSASIRFFHVF